MMVGVSAQNEHEILEIRYVPEHTRNESKYEISGVEYSWSQAGFFWGGVGGHSQIGLQGARSGALLISTPAPLAATKGRGSNLIRA